MSCFFGSAVYFTQYNAGDAGKYAIISNCLSMAQIVTLFITPFAMKKLSKKNLFMIGMSISGIGTAALGWVLDAGGFNAKLATQSKVALSAINWSFSWIPVITMIIIIVCMFFFDLDKKYDRAVAELEQGKHRKNKLQV